MTNLLALLAFAGGPAVEAEPPLPYPLPRTPYNTPMPAITPTYDGSGQAIHPGVLDFKDITPSGTWKGWRYWMGMTPYPAAQDKYENPSILVSKDGFTWKVPEGLTNPLYPWPGPGTWNYDFDIEYDPDEDKLWGTFNTSIKSGGVETVHEYMISSPDGITWPSEKVPLNKTAGDGTMGAVGLVRRGQADWWMFGMVNLPDGGMGIGYRRATHPAATWSATTMFSAPNLPKIWHWDVLWDGQAFRAIMHDGAGRLYAGSWDGVKPGFNWNTTPVLTGSTEHGAWDPYLYRSSITKHQDGVHYRLWYTGRSLDQSKWGIGYTWVPRSFWPAP